jgi:hypothetical protein
MTENQEDLIETISDIIGTWKNSNDLSSPTVRSDIKEEINKKDYLQQRDKQKLYNEIRHILGTIKYRVNG